MRLAWFRNRFTDLIDFDPETFSSINRSRVIAKGVEAEDMAGAARSRASGALTYIDLESETPLRAQAQMAGQCRRERRGG